MKYSHPAEIPLSKTLFFDWAGERMPLAEKNQAGDTHPQTWADDDEIYVGTGDPGWYEKDGKYICFHDGSNMWEPYHLSGMSGLAAECFYGGPEDLKLRRVNDMPGFVGYGGQGPKPSGMICIGGVLYYAAQNLLGGKTPPWRAGSQHGSDATIISSRDHGKTWEPDLNAVLRDFYDTNWDGPNYKWRIDEEGRIGWKDWEPMFPGPEFGGPSFVQFGKNNEGAPDDYVYAISGDQWDNGRFLRLGRVCVNHIQDRDKWEFASIDGSGNPVWHKDIKASEPILDIEGHIGLPEMVYIKSLKKFILLTWSCHTDFYTPTGSELTILESDNIWGPFSLVHYEWMWEKRALCAYTPRVPLKWFDNETLEGYILHSGNWGYQKPDGSWQGYPEYYRPHIRKFKFSLRDDPKREK